MSFSFATCDKKRALEFMKSLYPSQEVTEVKIGKLLSLVEKDVLRIQDPMMHSKAQVIQGTKYTESMKPLVDEAIDQLKAELH